MGVGPLAAVVVDAADPATLADFWAAAAGWPIGYRSDDGVSLHRPGGRPRTSISYGLPRRRPSRTVCISMWLHGLRIVAMPKSTG